MELNIAGETFGEVPRPRMLAWHNDPDLKAEALMRMKTHQVQDEFIQGSYFLPSSTVMGSFKGCFHGCLTSDKYMEREGLTRQQFYNMFKVIDQGGWYHGQGELIWGIPRELGQLLDNAFENFNSTEEAAMFAVESIEAMAVGADLNGVADAFCKLDDDAYEAGEQGQPRDPRWETGKGRAQILLQMLREAPVPNQES